MGSRRQGTYWLGTISRDQNWQPILPAGIAYLRGQLELGDGGFEHYQIFFICCKKESLRSVTAIFAPCIGHWELTRSSAAESYVWKELTRIGEPFEFGTRPIRRNSATDWESIKQLAIGGEIDSIPADIFIRYYRTLTTISADYLQPTALERVAIVYWGNTGTGKSRRAWDESGIDSYGKDPRSKFWCGYRGQTNVVVDEFRGAIDISHLLRWLDRYPVTVEIKGSSRPLLATRFWFTSNIHPERWYPDLDVETVAALMRRLQIIEMN